MGITAYGFQRYQVIPFVQSLSSSSSQSFTLIGTVSVDLSQIFYTGTIDPSLQVQFVSILYGGGNNTVPNIELLDYDTNTVLCTQTMQGKTPVSLTSDITSLIKTLPLTRRTLEVLIKTSSGALGGAANCLYAGIETIRTEIKS